MNEKVILEISGLHATANDRDSVEMIHSGNYYFRNGKHFVKYQESLDEGGVCENLLKISPKEVELVRKGVLSTTMLFTVGEKNITCYETPFGTLNMGIDTTDISITGGEDLMVVDIDYSLDMNCEFMSAAHVKISIKSAV